MTPHLSHNQPRLSSKQHIELLIAEGDLPQAIGYLSGSGSSQQTIQPSQELHLATISGAHYPLLKRSLALCQDSQQPLAERCRAALYARATATLLGESSTAARISSLLPSLDNRSEPQNAPLREVNILLASFGAPNFSHRLSGADTQLLSRADPEVRLPLAGLLSAHDALHDGRIVDATTSLESIKLPSFIGEPAAPWWQAVLELRQPLALLLGNTQDELPWLKRMALIPSPPIASEQCCGLRDMLAAYRAACRLHAVTYDIDLPGPHLPQAAFEAPLGAIWTIDLKAKLLPWCQIPQFAAVSTALPSDAETIFSIRRRFLPGDIAATLQLAAVVGWYLLPLRGETRGEPPNLSAWRDALESHAALLPAVIRGPVAATAALLGAWSVTAQESVNSPERLDTFLRKALSHLNDAESTPQNGFWRARLIAVTAQRARLARQHLSEDCQSMVERMCWEFLLKIDSGPYSWPQRNSALAYPMIHYLLGRKQVAEFGGQHLLPAHARSWPRVKLGQFLSRSAAEIQDLPPYQ